MAPFLLMTVLLSQSAGDALWLPAGSLSADAKTIVLAQTCAQLSKVLSKHYRNEDGVRVEDLRVVSTRRSDNWSRAALIPVDNGCRVRITPMYRLGPAVVDGAAPGPVTLVIHRHEGAAEQARDMDHLHKPGAVH